MPQDGNDTDLNHRERATLHAVAQGIAEITTGCGTNLFVDGLACADQATAHRLVRQGLIAPARHGEPGQRVPATLTDAGKRALGNTPALAGR
ncbi:hypothetical protein SAXI111661_07560 [Saccharomonospora xinjiangensis]|uniref:Uncharacterized protein n=1 Tax=Saccharomonospora xinjiangensis XJ-54 TaxID=882086 RepID=I0UZS8_9PSEU|nr:hypothetical protein [Saccharomonospora xinjiangensis]EID53381.1 hypothetical protein SacxiDRAFT_1122 [Saccharomonospora xinjiangensis XJ-54]QBQ59310.1 hypothetical protein EYD13_04685 [Saccharomonospora xinjiangensis]